MAESKEYKRPNFHPSQLNHWGRPREYDRVKIANDLRAWAELETSLNLNGFCGDQRFSAKTMLEWVESDPDFSEAYEEVRAILAERRERKLSEQTLHVKAYDLNASVYDGFLRREKRAQAEFEESLKSKEKEAFSDEANELLDKFSSLLSKSQDPEANDK